MRKVIGKILSELQAITWKVLLVAFRSWLDLTSGIQGNLGNVTLRTRHHGFEQPVLIARLSLNSKLHELTLINLSSIFMSLLIIVTQIIFWDCCVHFKVLLFARNNCIRLTAYLQLHIYGNLHSHLILRFWLDRGGRVGGGVGEVSAQRGTN